VVEEGHPVTEVAHRSQRVGHDDEGLAGVLEVGELLVALALELLVADGEDLIDQEDVGVDVDATENPRRTYMPDE